MPIFFLIFVLFETKLMVCLLQCGFPVFPRFLIAFHVVLVVFSSIFYIYFVL